MHHDSVNGNLVISCELAYRLSCLVVLVRVFEMSMLADGSGLLYLFVYCTLRAIFVLKDE